MPAHLKDPSVRARRNKSTTRRTLTEDHDVVAPELPEGVDWHPLTRRWWADLWASPMAPEYQDADLSGMFRVAMLQNDFWMAGTPKERAEIQVRLEKADADFGTNPLARRRLEWQIQSSEEAKARGTRRQAAKPAEPTESASTDARLTLVQ
ncbi:hypothetical protein BST28_18920 [Mycolicibacter kumamotonensis]|uniref:Bacteriophage protein n=1 Tax=Mycolicibacter kumamotonensis TaxID=354243 RepID=A0A1X0DY65_9MYCO|nr:hypothetical protein [Mycolicibacter kumamotonensis]ORA77192.1 hypothetical protein BST28_18920 [Mycolicibacter kumamotonensis]